MKADGSSYRMDGDRLIIPKAIQNEQGRYYDISIEVKANGKPINPVLFNVQIQEIQTLVKGCLEALQTELSKKEGLRNQLEELGFSVEPGADGANPKTAALVARVGESILKSSQDKEEKALPQDQYKTKEMKLPLDAVKSLYENRESCTVHDALIHLKSLFSSDCIISMKINQTNAELANSQPPLDSSSQKQPFKDPEEEKSPESVNEPSRNSSRLVQPPISSSEEDRTDIWNAYPEFFEVNNKEENERRFGLLKEALEAFLKENERARASWKEKFLWLRNSASGEKSEKTISLDDLLRVNQNEYMEKLFKENKNSLELYGLYKEFENKAFDIYSDDQFKYLQKEGAKTVEESLKQKLKEQLIGPLEKKWLEKFA